MSSESGVDNVEEKYTYKSPADILYFSMKGLCSSTMSSIPLFAWYAVSMSENVIIEPSAPPLIEKVVSYHVLSGRIDSDLTLLPERYQWSHGKQGAMTHESLHHIRSRTNLSASHRRFQTTHSKPRLLPCSFHQGKQLVV